MKALSTKLMRVWCWVPVVSEILNRKWKCIYICVELHHRCTNTHRFISREQRTVAVSKGKYQSYRVMERGAALVLTVLLLRGFECSSEASTGKDVCVFCSFCYIVSQQEIMTPQPQVPPLARLVCRRVFCWVVCFWFHTSLWHVSCLFSGSK